MADIIHDERKQPHYPYAPASTDEEILAGVLNALHHHTGVPSQHIAAKVKDGHVVLTGVVAQDFEKTLAEQAASEAPGVVEVVSRITLAS